ncbi:MAG TPA: DNA/RNA non-specific endonuclease [Pyrinomonadaceae bacterium]|nr:DNA/RNA non-specific endonuclease [Pyrinomonadaceae bacterium]
MLRLSISIIALLSISACRSAGGEIGAVETSPTPTAANHGTHLLFGNPSNAGTDPANYLVIRSVGAYSYNNDRGSANWASWRTTKDDLGEAVPRSEFEPDRSLPPYFAEITTLDYIRSGYDRGHLIPSADRWRDASVNRETFLMTNIVPQEPDLNQFPWEKLERQSRSWARWKFDVYTIAGVYGEQDRLRGKVSVPTNCWKVIVLVRRGRGLDSVDEHTRVIAVDMPNREGIANDTWEKYRTTVRSIEEKTGYDLLSNLPRELQDKLETRIEMRSP